MRAPHAFQLAEREDRQALCRRGAAELGGQTAYSRVISRDLAYSRVRSRVSSAGRIFQR